MESLNVLWFAWIGGGWHANPLVLALAKAFAIYGPVLVVLIVLALGIRHRPQRLFLLGSLLLVLLAALLAHRLAVAVGHPRPFMLGLSPLYIPHAARGSLPSVHASALFAAAFCLWGAKPLRKGAWAALAVALLTGWGRVYCGVHFPLDIAAGAALGLCLAVLYGWCWKRMGEAWQQQHSHALAGHGATGAVRSWD